MPEEMRTYLVGRRNSTVTCDIVLPESEKSVSRKHLELTITKDNRCYIVHVHPQNTTKVLGRDGSWVQISQDYVDYDAPLMLGDYRTTPRDLLAMLPRSGGQDPAYTPPGGGRVEWDPERGTFLQR